MTAASPAPGSSAPQPRHDGVDPVFVAVLVACALGLGVVIVAYLP